MDKTVILYSTGCPKCAVLKKKLGAAGIAYTENTDVEEMTALGLKSAPTLCVDGRMMDFTAAVSWLREQTVKKE